MPWGQGAQLLRVGEAVAVAEELAELSDSAAVDWSRLAVEAVPVAVADVPLAVEVVPPAVAEPVPAGLPVAAWAVAVPVRVVLVPDVV